MTAADVTPNRLTSRARSGYVNANCQNVATGPHTRLSRPRCGPAAARGVSEAFLRREKPSLTWGFCGGPAGARTRNRRIMSGRTALPS